MRTREQKGYVFKAGNWWFLRYWDSIVEEGTLTRKQCSRKLAAVELEHKRLKRAPDCVLKLAEDFLRPINEGGLDPVRNLKLGDFVRTVWLPYAEARLSASTVHTYRNYWLRILSPYCERALLRNFSTPAAQRLLDEIARCNPDMKKATLHNLKSILSAIFKLSIQQGYRPGPNPIRETSLPRAAESEETVAYDLDTVLAMLRVVPEPSRTAIAIAAFAGLRRGEIEGLTWESFEGDSLRVMRGMWRGIAGEPKTRSSKAPIPIIAALRKFLEAHHLRCGQPGTGIMFRTRNDTPLSMNNLLNDQMKPALERAGIAWHGFHAFRRGLATNLHALGVDDLTIQKILRHSDVAVTQRCYIKSLPEQSIAAMNKLNGLIDLICNYHATTSPAESVVN